MAQQAGELPLIAEPAPYSCPPVNALTRKLVLVDPASPVEGTLITIDGRNTPISWANKPFVTVQVDR